ncbi:MAG: hypothetical protein QOI20_2940 [Acidimicrobiaceae bacterium]|nr:hypothetical protein [Acidimicrobiaceae bacterium]
MTEPILPSGRDKQQVLNDAWHRARAIRRHRNALRVAPALALLLVVSVAAVAAAGGRDPVRLATRADNGPSTTTTSQLPTETPSTTAAGAAADPTASPDPSTTTTTAAAKPAVRNMGTTPAPPPASTTTTVPSCSSRDVVFSTVTDQSSYVPGTTVHATGMVKNISDRPCYGGYVDEYRVLDSDGAVVLSAMFLASREAGYQEQPLAPGGSRTGSVTWEQRTCTTNSDGKTDTCRQATPGDYRIVIRWGGLGEAASAPFTIGA